MTIPITIVTKIYLYITLIFTDNVLGVAQLCNKMNGPYFTTFDEDVASAFAVYCCISISHVSIYLFCQDT